MLADYTCQCACEHTDEIFISYVQKKRTFYILSNSLFTSGIFWGEKVGGVGKCVYIFNICMTKEKSREKITKRKERQKNGGRKNTRIIRILF